jgi:hypothetical protein
MYIRFLLPPLLFVAFAGCAGAQTPSVPVPVTQECPKGDTLPPVWSAWNAAVPLDAATSAGAAGTARFVPGRAIDLRLRPDPEVAYVSLPQGEGEATSFGGLASFRVEQAGRYGVGVGAGAWIDVSRDGKPTETALFGPGPACSPVRKVVAFDLVPGDYVLEISGNQTPVLRLMVAESGVPFPRE